MRNTVRIAWVLAQRELRSRYRESVLGLGWLILLPLAIATLYTLVFWGVFQARWPVGPAIGADSATSQAFSFGLRLFAGLAVFQFFADTMVRGTRAITDNAPLVKRLRFPVSALVLSQVMSSFVTLFVSLLICALVAFFAFGTSVSLVFLLIALGLSFFLGLGIALILAAFSAYLRDIQQVIPVVTSALLFMSPVFYPSSKAHGLLGHFLVLNPLSFPIELARAAIFSEPISSLIYSGAGILISIGFAALICGLGIWIFYRLKAGFADLV